ncbi:hypothetical protein LJB92_04440 [Bacteroidales bacterium OttesenSCG-928-M06]|nr:hypothetical protein [Bacteroidales bacterium OttesenSCG-928-M06]
MVRLLYFLLLILLSCSCYSKKQVYVPIDKEPPPFSIDFKVIYKDSNDTIVCFNDSLEFNVSITNQIDSVIDFRYYFDLIYYSNNGTYTDRLCNIDVPWIRFINKNYPYGDPVTILPRDTYSRKYKIKVTKDFFLVEKNTIQIEFFSFKYLRAFSDPIQIIVLDCY